MYCGGESSDGWTMSYVYISCESHDEFEYDQLLVESTVEYTIHYLPPGNICLLMSAYVEEIMSAKMKVSYQKSKYS